MEAQMATLNIKGLPDRLYRRLQRRARERHRSLAQEVTHILSAAVEVGEPLSILDLRGLGKDRWRDIHGPAHIEVERRSWD